MRFGLGGMGVSILLGSEGFSFFSLLESGIGVF